MTGFVFIFHSPYVPSTVKFFDSLTVCVLPNPYDKHRNTSDPDPKRRKESINVNAYAYTLKDIPEGRI